MPVTKPDLDASLDANYPVGVADGITAEKTRTHLTKVNTALGENMDGLTDLAAKLNTLKDRVDGFEHLTQDQRDTIDAFIEQNGGARGVISRVLANDAKQSFTTANAATLAEVASRMGRTDEEILEIVATAPANADTMQKLADLLQGQADLNTRIDNLPETPEGISQAHIDAINANTAKTGITAQEQADIVTNTEKVGITPTQAAALLKLIDDLEAANLRIDEAEALRRITPQEIADIATLNEQVHITPEQADKIAASDAIHDDLERRIAALEALEIPEGGLPLWNATTTYKTGDIVIHKQAIYRAIADNVTSAATEPGVGAAWQAGWELIADAKDASGLSQDQVDARIDNQLTFDIFESVIGSTAEIRPGITYTGNHGYQNDNGDDVPQTPPKTATFTIPTSGASVSDEINALNDGDLIRLVGNFNPNQTYVSGSQTETRVVVMQGDKTIKIIDNHPPNGGQVILDGAKKGPDLTATMTFTYNGITATMEPEIGGLDVSFTGKMYHQMDNFVNTRVAEATDPIKNSVGVLGDGLRDVQATAQSNEQGLVAAKKTLSVLGAKHTTALDAFGSGTISEVDNQVLTETATPWNKVLHENPTQFNEGLVNLTDGSLTIGEVILAEVKNGGLFFNLHNAGTPAASRVEPRYIGRSNGESNPVEIHLNSDITTTLTNNLPPAGSPVRIFIEADVNGLDVEDTQLDLVATIGQSVTHEVVHLGAVVSLTATWQANGLLIQTLKSGTANQSVDAGRLLVNPVWQETINTDKVDASDTLTRIGDHHGNAALYIHAVGGVYHIDYSGGSFETNTAHTSQTQITTAVAYVITVDSNFPANMHDLQAQADANNEYMGLWYYVNHPSQVVTLPFGLATTNPDGSTTPVGGGGDAPNGEQVARLVLTGAEIKTGNFSVDTFENAPPTGDTDEIMIFAHGARVIEPCSNIALSIATGINGLDTLSLNLSSVNRVSDFANVLRAASGVGFFINMGTTAASDTCQIELLISYMPIKLFG